MTRIDMNDVEQIKVWAGQCKVYAMLYATTEQMLGGEKCEANRDILNAIQDAAEFMANKITHLLWNIYDDWAGISEIRWAWRATHALGDNDGFLEQKDEINYQHEQVAGMLEDLLVIRDYVYSDMTPIPKDFMDEFIAEYGIFCYDEVENCVAIL